MVNTNSLFLAWKICGLFQLTGLVRSHRFSTSARQIRGIQILSIGTAFLLYIRLVASPVAVLLGLFLAVEFASAASARIRLETTDLNSNVITSVNVGDSFLLRGFVTDLRDNPQGVFSSYLNVLYSPSTSVAVTDTVTFIEPYTNAPSADRTIAGLIAKLGSFSSSFSPLGSGEKPQFNLRLQASTPGVVNFTGHPAQGTFYEILLYGLDRSVPTNEIQFANTTILVKGNPIYIVKTEVGTNGARLTLTGPPNSEIQMQTVTNLTNLVWQNLGGTVILGVAGTAQWIDLSATNHPMRFYRAFKR